jgi:hypothetical protein
MTVASAASAASIASAASSSSAPTVPRPLDGRRFVGVVLERGQSAGDADTVTFEHGRFRSTACDRYGYGDGAYSAYDDGGGIVFDAETESPKYGRLRWHGTVRGARLDATLTMLRDGVASGEKWLLAGQV